LLPLNILVVLRLMATLRDRGLRPPTFLPFAMALSFLADKTPRGPRGGEDWRCEVILLCGRSASIDCARQRDKGALCCGYGRLPFPPHIGMANPIL
jgi:hypothetical protein